MSFQNIVNFSNSISVEKRPIVAQSVSRDGTFRTVSRGGARWRFSVQLPQGMRYTEEMRQLIQATENLDRFTEDTISFNDPNHSWMFGYQGDQTNPETIQVQFSGTNLSIMNIVGGVNATAGFLFRAGDIIQATDGVNTGKVYAVKEDVPYNGTTIQLHRPQVNEPSYVGTITLNVGANCEFTVKCTQFPSFSFVGQRQVNVSGPFELQEVVD